MNLIRVISVPQGPAGAGLSSELQEKINTALQPEDIGTTVQGKLIAGTNVQIEGGVISAADTTYVPATDTTDGLLVAADKAKLDGIAENATANASDAHLLNRANHTGTQGMSTVDGLGDALAGKVDKVTGKGLSQEDFTTAEKNKLAGLESSHFKGVFPTLQALQSGVPAPVAGDYADVDGLGEDVERYIWDLSDAVWVKQGGGTTLTAAQIKTLYESNLDTNAFTDDEKQKLADALISGAGFEDLSPEVLDTVATYGMYGLAGFFNSVTYYGHAFPSVINGFISSEGDLPSADNENINSQYVAENVAYTPVMHLVEAFDDDLGLAWYPKSMALEGQITHNLEDGKDYRWDGTGWQEYSVKSALNLDQVDNTSDLDKPISTATQAALDAKLDASALQASLAYYMTETVQGAYTKMVKSTHDPAFNPVETAVESDAIGVNEVQIGNFIGEPFAEYTHLDNTTLTVYGQIRKDDAAKANAKVRFEVHILRATDNQEELIASSGWSATVALATFYDISMGAIIPHVEIEVGDAIVLKYFAEKVGTGTNPKLRYRVGGTDPMRAMLPVPVVAVGGDMNGPASSTAGTLAVFADASGKVLADSGNEVSPLTIKRTDPAVPALSADMVTGILDSDTGWTLPAGFSVSGNTLRATATGRVSFAVPAVELGKTYQLKMHMYNANGATVRAWLGNTDSSITYAVNTTHWQNTVEVITVASGSGSIGLQVAGTFSGEVQIKAIQLQEVTQMPAPTEVYRDDSGGVIAELRVQGDNVAIGNSAGSSLTTGRNNNLLGYYAGRSLATGQNNNLLGYYAGRNLTTGQDNNLLGYEAGRSLTTGRNNNLLGNSAGINLTTGQDNNLLGYEAGRSLTTGQNNNLLGYYAGRSLTTGRNNNLLGYSAGRSLTTGQNNNLLGYYAGEYAGATGSTPLTVVYNCTYFGMNTRASANNVQQEHVWGYAAVGSGSYSFTFGNDSNTLMVFHANTLRLTKTKTPASSTSAGTAGDICRDSDYLYICVADNSWKRIALEDF